MNTPILLPVELEQYRSQFEASVRDVVSISIKSQKFPLNVFQSKFGGNPYFPLNEQYPYNKKGMPLQMIAQINFEELYQDKDRAEKIKNSTVLKHLPSTGILGFYIDYCDDLLGCDLGDPTLESSYKIVYFPEIEKDRSKLISDFSFLKIDDEQISSVVDGELSLSYHVTQQPIVLGGNYEWDKVMGEDFYERCKEAYGKEATHLIFDSIENQFPSYRHQIGGYASFTQWDPRSGTDESSPYDFLLLQMGGDGDGDGDGDAGIIWGDAGIGNFFINLEKLKQRDFSDVLYHWDCH